MNDRQSLYFLWVTILNQSQDATKVLNNTLELFNRLGLMKDFQTAYQELTYEKIREKMSQKPIIHRFYKNMTDYLSSSIYMINKYYDRKPSNLFQGCKGEKDFKDILMQFRGIGEHKADTAFLILEKYQEIQSQRVNSIFEAKCATLYKTLGDELAILQDLGDERG